MTTKMTLREIRSFLFETDKYAVIGAEMTNQQARDFLYAKDSQDEIMNVIDNKTHLLIWNSQTFPRMMEVRCVSIDWVQREVIAIHNELAITHEYGREYRFWEHHREIQQKTKITIAEIAEKFGLEADKIEIVS
jgi:hypothetical protein